MLPCNAMGAADRLFISLLVVVFVLVLRYVYTTFLY